MINFTRLKLNFEDLTSLIGSPTLTANRVVAKRVNTHGIVDMRADDETLLPSIVAVLNSDDVTGLWDGE